MIDRDRLIAEYRPLAMAIATRWRLRLRRQTPIWDDIAGAASLGLCRAAAGFRDDGHPFAPFARLWINGEILEELKRWRGRACESLPDEVPAPEPPELDGRPSEVWAAYMSLPLADRDVLARVIWHEQSHPEISRAIGLRGRSSRKVYARALARLRAAVAEFPSA